ncbi:CehA/McbA family metallohydrolase [Iamia sp. SCSIO 61187]|uniref:CehA/McbA family metallohydrolase n=1 Tax=Iamia sp. SCSIO 61187 TaxID=2722752 RepID=UPI001C62993B|nr:CehA/McbA family metallohydrolase [Iamia sp. SCSIO 61187]QYG91011.1 CehA/McbA family metallohydrolase [Iamia sp. SCSIO 61187]
MGTAVHRLRFDLEDQAAQRYPELVFDPGGADSVEVTLRYDTDAAVVDLGCEGPTGWRGWSGGARSRFVIGRDRATPGYVPGEVEPGRWAVVLGLHAIPAEGVAVEVTISTPAVGDVDPEPPAPPPSVGPRGSDRALPAPAGLTWFAGDFHSHTVHSDGEATIAELAGRATANGLDVLAVTDHNTVSHHPHLAGVGAAHDITLLPGQEVTTARGHANAFGDIGWIDFRRPASEWVAAVEARGGLLSINHPLEGDCSWQHPLADLPPALELWHIGWFRDLGSTAMWGLLDRWDPGSGGPVLLGGSDFHHAGQGYAPGTPTTWVAAADRSPAAIMEAVTAGRTALSWAPAPSPTLLRVDDELIAVEADGSVLVDMDGRRRVLHGDRVRLAAPALGRGPFRLESAAGHLLAISP